jgi:hypothetical protein
VNARAAINIALAANGLLPMDGDCSCDRCGTSGLDRDDLREIAGHEMIARRASRIGKHFCAHCVDVMYLDAESAANPRNFKQAAPVRCHHHEVERTVHDRVRGITYTEWCPHCNGDSQ